MVGEPQPINVGTISTVPILQQEFLRWLSDPNEYFVWKEHTLRGEFLLKEENEKEVWKLPEGMTEQMTKEGAASITNLLRDYLNQFGFHSSFTVEQIEQRELPVMDEIDIYFKRNQKKFKISDENLDMMCMGFKRMVDIALHIDLVDLYEKVMKIGIGTPMEKQKEKMFGIFPRP